MEVLLVLIVMSLVLGYTVNSVAIQQKRNVEELQVLEVQEAGRRASFLLAGNPEFECPLHGRFFSADANALLPFFMKSALEGPIPDPLLPFNPFDLNDQLLFRLPSSINLDTLGTKLHRDALGIPPITEGYGCHVVIKREEPLPGDQFTSTEFIVPGCEQDLNSLQNVKLVYSLERNLVVCNEVLDLIVEDRTITVETLKSGFANKPSLADWTATITVWRSERHA